MKLAHLYQQIYFEPSLILPEAAASIRRLLAAEELRGPATGICGETVEIEQMQIADGIAYIPINGAVGQNLKPFQRGQGAVDVLDVMQEIDQAEADPEVRGAILEMDSPGGMVAGTPELSDRIGAMKKPVYTFSRGLIASAAYWIAAASDGIFTTRSANVGSIGVYLPWIDQTRAFEAQGLRVDVIKAGKLKGMGFPGTPLTEEQRSYLQDRVNAIYRMFTEHVRAQRGDIQSEIMQGQTFMAGDALGHGLIDAIVTDRSEVSALIP